MVQELCCMLGCTIGQLPEWEGEVNLGFTSSFSLNWETSIFFT